MATTPHQRPSDSEIDALHRALNVAARRWRARLQQRLRGHGLSELDALAITELSKHAPLKQQELAGRLGVSNTAVMQLVDRLEGAGLVERRPGVEDRRSNLLTPMASAAAALALIQAAVRAVGGEALSDISAEDVAATVRVLNTVISRLEF